MKKVLLLLLMALLPTVVSLHIYADGFKSGAIYYNIGSDNTVSVTSGDVKYSGDVVIPNQVSHNGIKYTVTSIEKDAFKDCVDLKTVSIFKGVTDIGNYAFSDCKSLTTISIPNSVTNIGEGAFWGCESLTSVAIPEGLKRIKSFTFCLCDGLTSITIPNSVTNIGDYAFAYCGLTSIISPNTVAPACGFESFYLVKSDNCVVWVPKDCSSIYGGAKGWKSFSYYKEIAIGDLNVNGVVDNNDLNALVAFIMGEAPEGFYEPLTDLNGDGNMNSTDVVSLVNILNTQGLSPDCNLSVGYVDGKEVLTSLTCTLTNNRNENIEVTKCELYLNHEYIRRIPFTSSLGSIKKGSKAKASFDNLRRYARRTGYSAWWYYKYQGENYVYRYPITK